MTNEQARFMAQVLEDQGADRTQVVKREAMNQDSFDVEILYAGDVVCTLHSWTLSQEWEMLYRQWVHDGCQFL